MVDMIKTITKAIKELSDSVPHIGRLVIGIIMIVVIIGFVGNLISSGGIEVSTTANTTVGNVETGFETNFVDPIESSSSSAIKFIPLAVIILVAGGFLVGSAFSGKKGKGAKVT